MSGYVTPPRGSPPRSPPPSGSAASPPPQESSPPPPPPPSRVHVSLNVGVPDWRAAARRTGGVPLRLSFSSDTATHSTRMPAPLVSTAEVELREARSQLDASRKDARNWRRLAEELTPDARRWRERANADTHDADAKRQLEQAQQEVRELHTLVATFERRAAERAAALSAANRARTELADRARLAGEAERASVAALAERTRERDHWEQKYAAIARPL